MNAFAPISQETAWPVIGHERAIQMLRRSIVNGRLSHAYLLTGPQGTGKRTLAIAFAMALNCQSGDPSSDQPPDVPCGLCSACQRICMERTRRFESALRERRRRLPRRRVRKLRPERIKIATIVDASDGGLGLTWPLKVYIGRLDRLNEEAACMLKTSRTPRIQSWYCLPGIESAVPPTISSRATGAVESIRKSTVNEASETCEA